MFYDADGVFYMTFHRLIFLIVKLSCLIENLFGNTDLTNVVEQSCLFDNSDVILINSICISQLRGILSACLWVVEGLVLLVIDGRVQVTNPEGCKTGCPACARICPEVAIIFPKYENSPVNGDEITNLDEQKERIRVDMQKILGDNVYAALAERRRLRQQRVLLRAPQANPPNPSTP